MSEEVRCLGPAQLTPLIERATRAWFSTCRREAWREDQPSIHLSDVYEITNTGRLYVVLRNCRGILAVFGVKQDGASDRVKWLRRWPAVLNNN
jgi:hypothetical protein